MCGDFSGYRCRPPAVACSGAVWETVGVCTWFQRPVLPAAGPTGQSVGRDARRPPSKGGDQPAPERPPVWGCACELVACMAFFSAARNATTAGLRLAPPSLVFPAIASEVVTSVPPGQIGIASGTNSALRELGGVFGVAILASVFTCTGVYLSATPCAHGVRSSLSACAALSAAVILLALPVKRPARSSTGGVTDADLGDRCCLSTQEACSLSACVSEPNRTGRRRR